MNTITGRLKQLLSSTLKHLLNSTLSTLNDPRASYPYVFNVTKALFGLHFWNDYVFGVQATLGPSMLPTMNARGDWVCVSKFYRRGKGVRVGDLVSAKHPTFPGTGIMKRVLGMPGDFVLRDSPDSGSKMMVQIPEGHCWLAGDNVPGSRDSRDWGPLPLAMIRGKVVARFWPLSEAGWVGNTLQPISQIP